MNKKVIVLIVLVLGISYRLLMTSGGNFLFNMDNARDFVDVREMVELKKWRLTGPSSAIEGLYNGPAWYYLLSTPYILTGGNPYGAIVMEIILWAIGGFFLLQLVKNRGVLILITIGFVWIASDYIVLATLYSFNPNPVTLLTPLFIYLLVEYLIKGKGIFIILTWFLGGLFFNFEMNIGVFVPLIIFTILFLINKKKFKDKYFWLGLFVFIGTLLPQVFFDLKHQFIMSKGVIKFLSELEGSFNPLVRFRIIWDSFFNTFEATMMNNRFLTVSVLILAIPAFKNIKQDIVFITTLIFVIIPFIGYLIIPVSVNPWHLGGIMTALTILVGFIIFGLWKYNFVGKIFSIILVSVLIFSSLSNILDFFTKDFGKISTDSSVYKNEIAAIDFVYKYAKGKNFKAYTYLPSVYDYPYQYLIWWYGRKQYGYLPIEYAYTLNKNDYISNKQSFSATKENLSQREDSNLVFLIKEPNHNYTRFGWEGEFISAPNAPKFESIEKVMVGPIEIEVRKEITQN